MWFELVSIYTSTVQKLLAPAGNRFFGYRSIYILVDGAALFVLNIHSGV
jgi:hypothetical protein